MLPSTNKKLGTTPLWPPNLQSSANYTSGAASTAEAKNADKNSWNRVLDCFTHSYVQDGCPLTFITQRNRNCCMLGRAAQQSMCSGWKGESLMGGTTGHRTILLQRMKFKCYEQRWSSWRWKAHFSVSGN
jgi:hypothetical protein